MPVSYLFPSVIISFFFLKLNLKCAASNLCLFAKRFLRNSSHPQFISSSFIFHKLRPLKLFKNIFSPQHDPKIKGPIPLLSCRRQHIANGTEDMQNYASRKEPSHVLWRKFYCVDILFRSVGTLFSLPPVFLITSTNIRCELRRSKRVVLNNTLMFSFLWTRRTFWIFIKHCLKLILKLLQICEHANGCLAENAFWNAPWVVFEGKTTTNFESY